MFPTTEMISHSKTLTAVHFYIPSTQMLLNKISHVHIRDFQLVLCNLWGFEWLYIDVQTTEW